MLGGLGLNPVSYCIISQKLEEEEGKGKRRIRVGRVRIVGGGLGVQPCIVLYYIAETTGGGRYGEKVNQDTQGENCRKGLGVQP